MKFRFLMENKNNSDFYFEHGLSILYMGDKKILFDTGQTDLFIKNIEKLNLDVSDIDYIILSHAHYDHTGGLEAFIDKYNYKNKIIVGSIFKLNKYKKVEDDYIYRGAPFKNNHEFIYVNDEYKLTDKITLYNNFKELNNFEKINDKFVLKEENKFIKDYFLDEVVMTIDTDKGLIIIVGCAHSGICNIVSQIKEKTRKKIRGIIGGFHLMHASNELINVTINELKKYNLEFICPVHCSGDINIYKKEFKYDCIVKSVGDEFLVDEFNKNYKKRNVDNKLTNDYAEWTDKNYKDGDRN